MRKDFWYVVVLHFLIMYVLTLLVEDRLDLKFHASILGLEFVNETYKLY